MSSGDPVLRIFRSLSRSRIISRINFVSLVFLLLHLAAGEIYGGNAASEPEDNQYADAQEKLASVADDIRDRLLRHNYRAVLVLINILLFSFVAGASCRTIIAQEKR
jgi:hypothetical protein